MNVIAVESQPVTIRLDQPIGSALGQIASFGCILVTVRTDGGITGENLVFTLNDRRTAVLRQMVDELADVGLDSYGDLEGVEGHQLPGPQGRPGRRHLRD